MEVRKKVTSSRGYSLLSVIYVTGTVLSTLNTLSHLILTATQGGKEIVPFCRNNGGFEMHRDLSSI